MKLSAFGEKFTSQSGILSLMDDLGNALAGDQEMIMMGGGNPAQIPAVEKIFKERLQQLLDEPATFRNLIGTYDPPQGKGSFVKALAELLRREYGWPITERNIALTNGSQPAFFMLFNMLAGEFSDGSRKHIQLPMCPEYIGYADAGLSPEFFRAAKPKIEQLENGLFKYRVDFSQLQLGPDTGAICVSRPTNPTGNVITDEEVQQLATLARAHDVPLILDGAYGLPFPSLTFVEAEPYWDDNTIVCLSLSKLGLPAVRTGMVIASEELISALTGINAIINLAPNSFGSLLTQQMVKDGSIIELSESIIRPFYRDKALWAVQQLQQSMKELPLKIHVPEGAIFLWLWFEDLPITSMELYERLKKRGVLIVSGHYFFLGLNEEWPHSQQCIRLNYAQDRAVLEQGIEILTEEVQRAYQEG